MIIDLKAITRGCPQTDSSAVSLHLLNLPPSVILGWPRTHVKLTDQSCLLSIICSQGYALERFTFYLESRVYAAFVSAHCRLVS